MSGDTEQNGAEAPEKETPASEAPAASDQGDGCADESTPAADDDEAVKE